MRTRPGDLGIDFLLLLGEDIAVARLSINSPARVQSYRHIPTLRRTQILQFKRRRHDLFHPATLGSYKIFCNDVRHENTIGVYNADLVIDSLPALLPVFNFVIHYRERKGESELPVKIVVTVPVPQDQKIFETHIPREAFK
jgi:hypothetical protein